MNTKLLQSNDELKRFAFIASHDLKEPLRNMGGFLSLMKRRLEQGDFVSLKEYVNFIEKNNYQMVDLVNNILEYSKIESGQKATMELTDLTKAVDFACALLAENIRKSAAEIQYKALPKIYYNAAVVRIILKNLLENALKYNRSEPPVVHIDCDIKEETVEIRVKDNGIGIAPQFHHKVFDMFVRLHNRSEYNGTGMGLAFCKKLLMNNGGTIRLESEEGQGSTFIVSLPAKVVHGDDHPAFLDAPGDPESWSGN